MISAFVIAICSSTTTTLSKTVLRQTLKVHPRWFATEIRILLPKATGAFCSSVFISSYHLPNLAYKNIQILHARNKSLMPFNFTRICMAGYYRFSTIHFEAFLMLPQNIAIHAPLHL